MGRIRAWLRVEDPTPLALLRIVVAVLVGLSPEVMGTMAHEARTAVLRTPPEGLGWLSTHLPTSPEVIDGARLVAGLAAAAGLLGFRSRAAFGILSISSFYLSALSESVGAVRHDMHLLWFTALLSVSPCGARLSVDARRRPCAASAHDVTASIWSARLLLAIVYFFPGYFKLREAGLAWALSDNLRNQMYFKWYQNAWLPAYRVDLHPVLLRAGALGVMALELGFPLLILSKRGRLAAAVGGLGFHLFADAFMRLGFSSLWWCYVVLVDWRPVVAWLHDEPAPTDGATGLTAAMHDESVRPGGAGGRARFRILAVGGVLVAGNLVQGFRGAVQAWPFACYPTFQYVAGTAMPDLVVAAVAPDGKETVVLPGTLGEEFREQRDWGIVWKLLGVYGDPPRPDGLATFYEREVRAGAARPPPPGTLTLRFYRGAFSTLPSDRGRPPLRRLLLAERPISSGAT